MGNLDKYFDSGTPMPTHPKLRFWGPLIADDSVKMQCEIYRKREGLNFSSPKIYVHYARSTGEPPQTDQDDWDDVLNLYLIENGIQSVSEENESIRFYLMLQKMLLRPETRFGEGYFNAILLMTVQNGFGEIPKIKELLAKIGEYRPLVGKVYHEAVEMIESAIRQCAELLVKKLKYSRPAAEQILSDALAGYLDERFSITNLRLLGWE